MFGTLHSVPYLYTYEQALDKFNSTTPIRGSDPVRVPLGSRKHRHLSINKTENNSIQCILYNTPVVTFKPDGDVVVAPGGYSSMFTCQFINAVLYGVRGRHARGRLVLNVNDKEFVLAQDGQLVLRLEVGADDKRRWTVKDAGVVWAFRINKSEATKVRSEYKEFLNFYKAFVKLNTARVADGEVSDDPFAAKGHTSVSIELIKDALGTTTLEIETPRYNASTQSWTRTSSTHEVVNFEPFAHLNAKPRWFNRYASNSSSDATKRVANWEAARSYLLALMSSDKTEDHLKASIAVFMITQQITPPKLLNLVRADSISVAMTAAKTAATDLLYNLHSDRVFEYVPLPVNAIPSNDYAAWMFKDECEAAMKKGKGEA